MMVRGNSAGRKVAMNSVEDWGVGMGFGRSFWIQGREFQQDVWGELTSHRKRTTQS